MGSQILELDFEKKYDYVVLYDVSYLDSAKKSIKSNGTILLVVNNKFGISYCWGSIQRKSIFKH